MDGVVLPATTALSSWLASGLASIQATVDALVSRGITPNLLDPPCDAPAIKALGRAQAQVGSGLAEVRGAGGGGVPGARQVVDAWCDRLVAFSGGLYVDHGDAWCAAGFLDAQRVRALLMRLLEEGEGRGK